MWHGSELTSHLLQELGQEARTIGRDVRRIRKLLEELATWLKRMALLTALYGSGLLMLLLSQEKAELVIRLVKAVRARLMHWACMGGWVTLGLGFGSVLGRVIYALTTGN